jgi:rfaE bifunctional protein kinase chain/domain/rfaE bifunctional protein nucleotidyltransferase chain/domain
MINLNEKNILKKIKFLKLKKKKIVLCHGVFDLVHLGHIEHFKSAKRLGDYLIVSITKDKFIKKGPGRPFFTEHQRMEYLSNIKISDMVIMSNSETSLDIINLVKPDFYVKGPDYKDNYKDKTKKIFLEKKAVKRNKGKIKFTNDITFSSSNLLNTNNFIFSYQQRNFLNNLKKKFNYNEMEKILKKFKNLRVLVIGELIIDKYCFGDIIGKSGKEPHLVLKENSIEHYLGGSAAIARHLSTFVKDVTIISPFGKEKFYEKIIKKNFDKNVINVFFKPYPKFKTIIKTRFVDKNSNYKLFGSYLLPDKMNSITENKIIKLIKKNKHKTDMTLVCDYGHNFISKKIATEIIKKNRYTFLNAQVNASNKGFHNMNKYSSLNSIVINENELRQELRDSSSDIKILAKILIKKKKIQNLIVTRGSDGAILINNKYKVFSCPGFALKIIDKVGAGDAMLSLVSLGLKLKLDPQLILFIGSLAAAMSVENIGNKEHLTYHKLDRTLEYMLK